MEKMSRTLLAMSSSPANCDMLRGSRCIPLLVQLLHLDPTQPNLPRPSRQVPYPLLINLFNASFCAVSCFSVFSCFFFLYFFPFFYLSLSLFISIFFPCSHSYLQLNLSSKKIFQHSNIVQIQRLSCSGSSAGSPVSAQHCARAPDGQALQARS